MKKIILVALMLIINSSLSYSFDNKKCGKINSIKINDKTIEDSMEKYAFHFSEVFAYYYALNQLTKKKCPMILENFGELSKDGIYDTMFNKFPTNRLVEQSGYRQCLLSHLYKKDTVEILSSHQNTLSKIEDTVLKHFEDSKKLMSKSLKYKFKLDKEPKIDLICKFYYIEMYRSKKGYGRIGKALQKIENEAVTEIKKINNQIFNYCLDNDCEFN